MLSKQKIKVVIVDKVNLDSLSVLDKKRFEVVTDFGISNEEVLKKYSGFNVLVVRSIRTIDEKFIKRCRFNVIATVSKGFDNIDVAAAKRKKIAVMNTEKGNSISAAEFTMALILNAMKNISLSEKLVKEGKFEFYDYKRNELLGKKIGIIGYGNVGSYVGKLCKAFGMKVYANDTDKNVRGKNPTVEFKSLKFVLKNCEIITVHIPLSKKNFHFIDKAKFDCMNSDMVFINTSRGSVIDEKELIGKLKRNELRYVCLDVFENEPSLNKEFFKFSNTTLTNHIAGKTQESAVNMAKEVFLKIKKYYS
jgi:D-3-phosphoglycerate dehydrogenase